MSILLNSAGGSAADPILKALALTLLMGASSFDIATVNNAYVDTNNTFPGTNSIKSSLSPASSVVTSGNNGSYATAGTLLTISSTTGLSAGDYLYLAASGITSGLYQIASIASGTTVTLTNNPFSANTSGVSYQVAYRYSGTAGTAPIASSAGGTQNYLKFDSSDSVGNATQYADFFYVADAPSGSAYISIGGKTYTGQTINTLTPSLTILSGWTNKGGIATVKLVNHSVQARNDFTFGDTTTAEKTVSAAQTSGLKVGAGDGIKYGRLEFRSLTGSAQVVGVDIDTTTDTVGPSVVLSITGR